MAGSRPAPPSPWAFALFGLIAVPVAFVLLRRCRGLKTKELIALTKRPKVSPKRQYSPPVVIHTLRPTEGRVVLVGDVHGCLEELDLLLREVAFQPGLDVLVMLGDLVAKGPKSSGVIARCKELGAEMVLGNHDWEVLRWRHAIATDGPDAVLAAANPDGEHRILAKTIPPELLDYLQAAPHILTIPQHNAIAVHAGIDPALPLDQQNAFDLMNMRVIVDGVPHEKHKGALWGTIWEGPELVVFGHNSRQGFQEHPHAIGLDTGCVKGQRLSCLLLPSRAVVSVPATKSHSPLMDDE